MHVFIKSYGCTAAQADAEIMAGLLKRAGIEVVASEDIADIVVVTSCTVKTPTEQKIFEYISRLHRKGKKVIIAGCLVDSEPEKIRSRFYDASLVSTHQIINIAKAVKEVMQRGRIELLSKVRTAKTCLPHIRKNPYIAIVQIAEGCTGHCTYCATRIAKGGIFSYPEQEIVKEIVYSVAEGCKEVQLTSQDNAAYGLDRNKYSQLPGLLAQISNIPGNFRIRIGMMNVDNIVPVLDKLIDAYRNERVYKFLHIPIQSGSNTMLRAMGRRYAVEDWIKVVKAFRAVHKDITLWTDIIVGYPGESHEDFQKSIDIVEKIMPDYVNISKFWPRPNTPAMALPRLDTAIIKKRSIEISTLVKRIAQEKHKRLIGWKGKILVTERGRKAGQFVGRTPTYKPVIVESKTNILGQWIDTEIIDATAAVLKGKIIFNK